jgi:MIP family channel proteins
MTPSLVKQCVAEFVGTFALVFIGIGAIYNDPGLLGVALAHGLTIAVMAPATMALSGAQFNPAVTFGLLVAGKMDTPRSLSYLAAQLTGATAAALLLVWALGDVKHVAAGTPDLGQTLAGTARVSLVQAVVIEAVLTFFLVFVIFGVAVDARGPKTIAGLAIGFTITADILFGGPLTGAAMNPARVFGPALISGHWQHHLVYWLGPLLGGGLAGVVYGRFLIKPS